MMRVFDYFRLTIAHYIPFAALKHIEHIHFDDLDGRDAAQAAWRLLWDGGKLTADINQDKIRRKADFPGILQAEGMEYPKAERSNSRYVRHLDTHPQGKYALRKVSFESLCERPMEVDLSDETVVSLDQIYR
jgi:hypothetical protein